jgi:RHS repeat-associated protein
MQARHHDFSTEGPSPVPPLVTPWEKGSSSADPRDGNKYLHARYFDPKLGTFLSPDPIGVFGGLNAYAYSFGSPVNLTDGSGLTPVREDPRGPEGLRSPPRDLGRMWTHLRSGAAVAVRMGTPDAFQPNPGGGRRGGRGRGLPGGNEPGPGAPGIVIGPPVIIGPPPGPAPAPVLFTPPGVIVEYPEAPELTPEDFAQVLTFAGIAGGVAASCVPGVGETMDLATLFASDSTTLDRCLAAASLGVNLATAGYLPNFGAGGRLAGAMALDAGSIFTKVGIRMTPEFQVRLVGRASRGVTEVGALDAYRNGRLFFDRVTGRYVRYSSRTGITVITNAPSNGLAITVFEGGVSPKWLPLRRRPGQ